MRGRPNDFWGKWQPGAEPEWHPLLHHCADVGCCLERLLAIPIMGRRLARTGGLDELDPIQIARLAVLATWHDLGKFNLGFQEQILEGAKTRYRGHVQEAAGLLGNPNTPARLRLRQRLLGALDIQNRLTWGNEHTVFSLLWASISHHGRPAVVDAIEPVCTKVWQPKGNLDPLAGLDRLGTAIKGWFPAAFSEEGPPLPNAPAFVHHFAGLVILADWITSDPAIFPYAESADDDRSLLARQYANQAILDLGLDGEKAREVLVGAFPDPIQLLRRSDPRPIQQAMHHLPPMTRGGITLLEAETGSGKTEAAFFYFLRLYQAGLVDGLYFALPTRSAAVQIHRRILELTQAAFGTNHPPVLLAVPGYLRVDAAEGRRLAPFTTQWPDQLDDERGRHRYWAAENPKRFLAAPMAVGTIDQVLLSVLRIPHTHLRASVLPRLLLVVDEVHASDRYMTELLQEVLRRLLAMGGQALLLSATLGSAAKAELLAMDHPNLIAAKELPYPAISRQGNTGEYLPMVLPPGPPPNRSKSVAVILHPLADDPAGVAELALAHAQIGGRILVIRNTVTDAIATQQALENIIGPDSLLLWRCQGIPTLHHGRFASEDRRLLDQALETAFGKEATRDRGVVAITTRTAEQSLDIDADRMITDLCPMDVLLQRIGRLHRHERNRPAGMAETVIEILLPVAPDFGGFIDGKGEAWRAGHGWGTVFDDLRILEATWLCLQKNSRLNIPADNRRLVEGATHPEALAAISQLGAAWQKHQETTQGRDIGQRGTARRGIWSDAQPFDDTLNFDEDKKITTRLGANDRLVELTPPRPGPFGPEVKRLTIPGFWLQQEHRGDDKAEATAIQASDNSLRFHYNGLNLIYDRLGLRRIEAEPTANKEVRHVECDD